MGLLRAAHLARDQLGRRLASNAAVQDHIADGHDGWVYGTGRETFPVGAKIHFTAGPAKRVCCQVGPLPLPAS